jgi:hypothetical protein
LRVIPRRALKISAYWIAFTLCVRAIFGVRLQWKLYLARPPPLIIRRRSTRRVRVRQQVLLPSPPAGLLEAQRGGDPPLPLSPQRIWGNGEPCRRQGRSRRPAKRVHRPTKWVTGAAYGLAERGFAAGGVRPRSTRACNARGDHLVDLLPPAKGKIFALDFITSPLCLAHEERRRTDLDTRSEAFARAFLEGTYAVWVGAKRQSPPRVFRRHFVSVKGSNWKLLLSQKTPYPIGLARWVVGVAMKSPSGVLHAECRHPLAIARLPSVSFLELHSIFSTRKACLARTAPQVGNLLEPNTSTSQTRRRHRRQLYWRRSSGHRGRNFLVAHHTERDWDPEYLGPFLTRRTPQVTWRVFVPQDVRRSGRPAQLAVDNFRRGALGPSTAGEVRQVKLGKTSRPHLLQK